MTDWDDIKKQLQEAEEPLSEGAWTDMEQMLDAGRSRHRYRWYWAALLAACIIGLFLAVPMLWSEEEPQGFTTPPGNNTVLEGSENKKARSIEDEEASQQPLQNEEQESSQSGERLLSPSETIAQSQGSEEEFAGALTPERIEAQQKETTTQKEDAASSAMAGPGRKLPGATSSPFEETDQTGKLTDIPAKDLGLPGLSLSPPSLKEIGAGSPIPLEESTQKQTQAYPDYNYRWEVRAFAMATYNLAPEGYVTNSPTTHVDYGQAVNNAVKPGIGFDAGVELKYRVFKHFKIGGGIEYRKLTQAVNYAYETNKIPLIDSASGHIIDYLTGTNVSAYNYRGSNEYTFISLPFSVYYEVPLKGKWSLGGEAIYNHSFLLGQNAVQVNPTQLTLEEQENTAFRSAVGSVQFRLSLMYALSRNLYLAVEPGYRQYLQNFDKSNNVQWKPRDINLSWSMIYRFTNEQNK